MGLFRFFFCYTCDVATPCSFLDVVTLVPLVLDWYSPSLVFCKYESCYPNSSSWCQTWKVRFFFNLCLLMNFFNYPCFWEMLVDNLFFRCVHKLFGHCTFNYTYFIFFIFLSMACKCLS